VSLQSRLGSISVGGRRAGTVALDGVEFQRAADPLDPSPRAAASFMMPALPSRRSALIAASFRASMGLRPNLLPYAFARSSPALTRSWIIARSNLANTPIIWNRALDVSLSGGGQPRADD
jgi:hypothetical protein